MDNLSLSDNFSSSLPSGAGAGAGPGFGAASGSGSGMGMGMGMGTGLGPGSPQLAPMTQLPPQMFTTAAQLLDLTDKKLLVVLRDGKKLVGTLRSWDQFANLVLQSTVERVLVPFPDAQGAKDRETSTAGDSTTSVSRGLYADIPTGLYLIRGENVLLLGEIDLDKDDEVPPGYEKADVAVVRKMVDERKAAGKEKEKLRLKKLAKVGFEGENLGEALF